MTVKGFSMNENFEPDNRDMLYGRHFILTNVMCENWPLTSYFGEITSSRKSFTWTSLQGLGGELSLEVGRREEKLSQLW